MTTITKVKFVLLFILCVATLPVSSHPGRTDSNGGHYDRSTGEYHYHDGKYAGREQSESTSKKEEKPFTPPREPEQKIFIEIIEPSQTYYAGEKYEFSAKIPENYNQDDIVWRIDNTDIAELNGNVLTLQKEGKLKIIAELDGESSEYHISIQTFKLVGYIDKIIPLLYGFGYICFLIASFLNAFSRTEKIGCILFVICIVFMVLLPFLGFIIQGVTFLFYKIYFWNV